MYKHAGAGWSIRPFTLNDRISCLRIFSDCLRDFPWRGDWKAYLPVLQNAFVSSRVLVAEEPSAGMIAFLTVQMRTGYVDHLFVDEDWRLCGVGRGLLEVARYEAARPLILDVDMLATYAPRLSVILSRLCRLLAKGVPAALAMAGKPR